MKKLTKMQFVDIIPSTSFEDMQTKTVISKWNWLEYGARMQIG